MDQKKKKKVLNIFGKVISLTLFKIGSQKQKNNNINKKLDFQKIFDKPLANYLISKEFFECIGYISSYLPKSE